MTDTWNVTAAYDKPSYNKGDTMTITISGNDVLTDSVTSSGGNITILLRAANGATSKVTLPPAIIATLVSTPESVAITGIQDDSGRVWAIQLGGLKATAVA